MNVFITYYSAQFCLLLSS